jgi:lipopolysaccharide biosynthesis glycosyltransferase
MQDRHMDQSLDIYIGWDSREPIAYDVAKKTLEDHASVPVRVFPIKVQDLVAQGAYTREIDPLASTEFTYSRFFVPFMAGYKGWALFCDCDFLFLDDVAEILKYRDPALAVACVKHDYTPKATVKMDGKVQTSYPRKNWSSFMLFNCEHPSTRQLTPELINRESGAYLHRMQWAKDEEIGEIPTRWNWLEGWNEKPETGLPGAVHFTNGGPWFKDWQDVDYGDLWRAEADKVEPGWKPI